MTTGEPRFIAGTEGELFVLEFKPDRQVRGTVLFFPPFGEEMNRSRRMVSRQAKIMAGNGFHVIIPDFYGTGDSEGEFFGARWQIWKSDMELLANGYDLSDNNPVSYWGLRLGVLMAMDVASQITLRPARLIAWSPVLNGKQFVNQLLRMRTMANMLAGSGATETVASLRGLLESGLALEVGGYELSPELIKEIDNLAIVELFESLAGAVPVEWCEMIATPGDQASPAVARNTDAAAAYGDVNFHSVVGPDFWTTAEIVIADELIGKTINILR